MVELGLQPSDTGNPGGKAVGEHMSHYVLPDGRFIQVCKQLLTHTGGIIWFDRCPVESGKDYSYAGKIIVPATAAKAASTFEIENGAEPSVIDTAGAGQKVEVPMFSAIPQTLGGLNLAPKSEPGILTGGGNGRSVDSSNRVKYTCDGCGHNIWGKQNLNVSCDDCRQTFKPRT